ncbi:hypothetical protein EXIGLDRAFT_828595 [Exidia glandulosa HHB12029]|uniref:50S ribosomal protein L35 n=1 Tax=Exidia glandulosa HHB12029 TaxID=1314781 RepID=A0A165Q860_EXIGL|nr:hypothetical protein EXIGLDRAFT_828595 [Exidia glandulosa HHB12029]
MFSLLTAAVARGVRSFSSSASTQKYKLKTHSGTRKRFKALPSGLFKRVRLVVCGSSFGLISSPSLLLCLHLQGQPGRVHNNTPSCRENNKPRTAMATPTQRVHLKRLMPYA